MKFELHFCEYNRRNRDEDRIFRPEGSGDYLFLLLKTPMKVYENGKILVTGENACILYTPGHEQHYQGVRRFLNSYVHFDCEENLGERFGVPQNTVFYPRDFEQIDEYIRQIQKEYMNAQPFAPEQEYFLLCQMMICAARGLSKGGEVIRENQDLYERFLDLRLRMLSQCEYPWTTRELCDSLNMEKSQFYAYYKKFFQTTPHGDLLLVRMDKARTLLTNEAIPVTEVAQRCGFSSLPHFCRYFKKVWGCAPGDCGRKTPLLR